MMASFYGLVRTQGNFDDGDKYEVWSFSFSHEDAARPDGEYIFATGKEDAFTRLCERYPCPLTQADCLRVFGANDAYTVWRHPRLSGGSYDLQRGWEVVAAYLAAEPERCVFIPGCDRDGVYKLPKYYDSDLVLSDDTGFLRYDPVRAAMRRKRFDTKAANRAREQKDREHTAARSREFHGLQHALVNACTKAIGRVKPFCNIITVHAYGWENLEGCLVVTQAVLKWARQKDVDDRSLVAACRALHLAALDETSALTEIWAEEDKARHDKPPKWRAVLLERVADLVRRADLAERRRKKAEKAEVPA